MRNDAWIVLKKEGSIKEYKYHESETLGQGQFGKVYKGYDSSRGVFAIKTIDLREVQRRHNTGSVNYMRREVELMREISQYSHPNAVNLVADFERDLVLYLVMECCQTDLGKFITSKKPALGLPEDLCRAFLLQLASGLKFLNDLNYIHRDLKPPNILLLEDSDYTTIKISDFGLSKKADLTQSQVGSPLYMAPEVISGLPYTFKYDVWSAGCIFFEMLTGKNPFDSYRLNDIKQLNYVQKKSRPADYLRNFNNTIHRENRISISGMAMELLDGLLAADPKNRWDWDRILDCNYFNNKLMKLSVVNFQKQEEPESKSEPAQPKQPKIEIENKYRQRRITCRLFYPHGLERQLLINPGKAYTINAIKESAKCQNCQVFNVDGVLYSDNMVFLNAACENPEGREVSDLYIVNLEAYLSPPAPFRFPQGEARGSLPEVPLVSTASYDAIDNEKGRERIMELCDLSRKRLYNVTVIAANMELILRQLLNANYSTTIQKKILTVVQCHIAGEIRNKKETTNKYLKQFEALSSTVPTKADLSALVTAASPEALHVINSQFNIVEYSNSLKTNLESLLSNISTLTSDRESPLKQTFIMDPNFDKNYTTPIKTLIQNSEKNRKKFEEALAEATKIFHYDFETGEPPKFTFPTHLSLASNASELNKTLNESSLPFYNDIISAYAEALQKRSAYEAEKDKSTKECFEKLKSLKSLSDQTFGFSQKLEQYSSALSQYDKAVKELLGLKAKLTELSRQSQTLPPLGEAIDICQKAAKKEAIQRDMFDIKLKNNHALERLFPAIENYPQRNTVESIGIPIKEPTINAPLLIEKARHCYHAVAEGYANIEVPNSPVMKIISNNANLIHENRKEEAANTNLGIQMAKDLRAVESGKRRSISSEKLLGTIEDERRKIEAFENKISEYQETIKKQEEEIVEHQKFFASVIGEQLLNEFRKSCEARDNGANSIKDQFLSGSYSNPAQQYDLWTLYALVSVVLDPMHQGSQAQQLEKAKQILLNKRSSWDRPVSFAELIHY